MRLSVATFLSAISLFSTTSGRIVGFSAPVAVTRGQEFNVTLRTQNYIQPLYNVAVAFGIAPGNGYPDFLGPAIGSYYLGPSKSNVITNLNFTLSVDNNVPLGPSTLSASLMSLLGAESMATLSYWNAAVTFLEGGK